MLVITLNELSLQIQPDIPAARDMMKKFVAAFTTASSEYHSELRLHSTIYLFNTEIAPNYLISQWIDDAQGDRPSQTRFRSILQKNSAAVLCSAAAVPLAKQDSGQFCKRTS